MRTRAKRLVRLLERRRRFREQVALQRVNWQAVEQAAAEEWDPPVIEQACAIGLAMGVLLELVSELEADAEDDWVGQEAAYT